MPNLEQIRVQIAACRLCDLAKARTQTVPGEGDPRAKVMLIGEAPGFYEDQQGRPFVGAAGQFLEELLNLAGLSRRDVFITNVVKCRPPGNRDPEPEEMAACDGYLRAQIEALAPTLIVTLGRFSLAKFFPQTRGMKEVHGRALSYNGLTICAMYHPAAALHQGSLRQVLQDDFKRLPAIIERLEAASDQAAPGNGQGATGDQRALPFGALAPAAEQMTMFDLA
ncbi:MAG TPA: uracil-DNA glycosylase [Chloroflexota bacterium]